MGNPVLHDVRVAFVGGQAAIAGRMLAQLGAQVLLLEPPEGDPARRMPPFDDTGRSLFFEGFAAGMRSVVLDLATEDGADALDRILAASDILIDAAQDWPDLRSTIDETDFAARYPSLIQVAITPFGRHGPRAGWAASDLTIWASGGPLYPSRDSSGPPLAISVPQAWHHGALDAVTGALLALRARERSGRGQTVDVSVQASVAQATLSSIVAAGVGHERYSFIPSVKPAGKSAPDLSGSGSRTRRSRWPCRDGVIEMHLGMGPAVGAKSNTLFAWIAETVELPGTMAEWDWVRLPAMLEEGEIAPEDVETARTIVADFIAARTKEECLAQAMRRRVLMAPSLTVADLAESRHHGARAFFEDVQTAAGNLRLPGRFAQGIDDAFAPLSPAPELGEANADMGRLEPRPLLPARPVEMPLSGLKVLDLAWVVAGPAVGRVLADYSATVVRVENRRKPDTARLMGPFPGGKADFDKSALFETFNTGKLSLGLDVSNPEARPLIEDLVRWADVVVESFAPGQMERWGLGYDTLRAIRPDILVLSTSLMGQSGPYSECAGYGNIGAAMSGFQRIVGHAGRDPIGPFGPYTDFVAPRFATAALLAALRRREATGEGAWIDVSQAEAGLQLLSAQFADFSATGRLPEPRGNRAPDMAPHGVFACAGDDRWIALAVRSDREWTALAAIIGDDARPPEYATLAGRKQHEDALEAVVSRWTQGRSAEEAVAMLQEAGIPAYIAASSEDIMADPQLAARGHFRIIERRDGSDSLFEASRCAMSVTAAQYRRPAPGSERDTDEVLRNLLGYSSERIAELSAKGIFA